MTAARRLRVAGGLAVRHALAVAVIGLALGLVFGALQLSRAYRDAEDKERRDIAQMLAVVGEPAAQAAYNLNAQAATVVVHGAIAFEPVCEAELRNDFGEVLAHGSNDRLAASAGAWWTRFVAPTQEHRLPLAYGTPARRVGELRVVTAQGPRVERFLQGVWQDVVLSVLRSLVVALALGVWFYATLARPLAAVAQRIRRGPAPADAAPPAEVARSDEIGEIAQAFERYEREARERALSLEASASALAASEQRHRRVVETAGEGVWQVDEQGRTTLANEAMAQMLGTSVAVLVGRSMFDFMDEDERRAAATLFFARRGSHNEHHEFRFQRADGRLLWAEVSSCPVSGADGRRDGVLLMVTDATERRRRDDELRASNAQLRSMVGDLERHKHEMAQIAELNELLQSASTEAEAYDVIGAVGGRLFPEGSGGLSVTGSGDEMLRASAWGADPWVPARFERACCWAIRRGGPHLQTPEHGVKCTHLVGEQTGKLLCVPLYLEGRLLGVLHVGDGAAAGHDLLDDSLRQRMDIFGEVIKLGLSNLRLRESLRDQALRDALTGLPNRRLFDDTLLREVARCLRTGQPLTVAVVDVDRFKHFNDTYGHDVGDRVLRWVAGTLQRGIRSGDLACRYGGDEFVCLLIGATPAEAQARLGRLLELDGTAGSAELGELPEPVHFTIGLAGAPESGDNAAALMRAADAALYAAKARGGHCLEVAVAGAG